MSMQIKSSLSPQHMKLIVIGAGLLGLLTVWDVVQKKIADLAYQPVYGEQAPATTEVLREELYSLPIVVAKSETKALGESEISDADIEAAFRKPVFEEPEEASEPVKVTLSQQFLALYRPVVNGVSGNGAIVNGQFWSVGERMASMPLRASSGEVLMPKIQAIGIDKVVIGLGDESLPLNFRHN